jgi:hypothetical protein
MYVRSSPDFKINGNLSRVRRAVVRKIVEGTIDEAWVRALAEVEKRSKAMDAKIRESRKIKGISDLRPLLENLIKKVNNSRYVKRWD